MSEKSKKGSSYTSLVEQRIRRFYVTLVALGLFVAFCWFLVLPWITRSPHSRHEGEDVALQYPAGASVPVRDTEDASSQSPESPLRMSVEKLEEELAQYARTNEILRMELVEKQDDLQSTKAELESERESTRAMQVQWATADAKAMEASDRLQDAMTTLQEAAKRLETMKALEGELTEFREQNRTLDAKGVELHRLLAASKQRGDELQRVLDGVQNEEFRQKQILVELHEQMRAGQTNALLLDSVAMAKWRLLRYDAEWVLRGLSAMTPETQAETVRECIQRLQENLTP